MKAAEIDNVLDQLDTFADARGGGREQACFQAARAIRDLRAQLGPDSLKALIDELIADTDDEFRLGRDHRGEWSVDFVNPVDCVALGETLGVYTGEGATPEEALRSCITRAHGK